MRCSKCGKTTKTNPCEYCGFDSKKDVFLLSDKRFIGQVSVPPIEKSTEDGEGLQINNTNDPDKSTFSTNRNSWIYSPTQKPRKGKQIHSNSKRIFFICSSLLLVAAILSFVLLFVFMNRENNGIDGTSTNAANTSVLQDEAIHFYNYDLQKDGIDVDKTYFGPNCYSTLKEKATNDNELITLLKEEMYNRMDKDPAFASASLANIDQVAGTHYSAYVSMGVDKWLEAINQTVDDFLSDKEKWKETTDAGKNFLEKGTFSIVDNIDTNNRMGMDSTKGAHPYIIILNEGVAEGHFLHCKIMIKGTPVEFDYYIEGGFIPVNVVSANNIDNTPNQSDGDKYILNEGNSPKIGSEIFIPATSLYNSPSEDDWSFIVLEQGWVKIISSSEVDGVEWLEIETDDKQEGWIIKPDKYYTKYLE